ncbi:uncharacterized protein PV09_01646 [Verruconis gallopava]|uniref:Uncharacterized protein n=1 Tax=Verruconis gallopava TaxID=253628 RepID=A0A0D2B8Y3_9PEZI|nr:uncharacterized protein PV09_01646 [Verruconis gallopava]KIW07714.1 hypothetical protein PV09_01646 [Verruconis gallopava]
MAELQHWEQTKQLFLFTSLTAGSSHIVTATSRIETILRNARIPFTYIDTATNESARKLFQRRARGKKLPLLVKEGFVIGDLEEIEELNEFGELEDAIGEVDTTETSITTAPAKMIPIREGGTASNPTPTGVSVVTSSSTAASTTVASAKEEPKKEDTVVPQQTSVMGQLAAEAAAKAKEAAKKVPTPILQKASSTEKDAQKGDKEDSRETPLSPSGVPLPMSPAVKSPSSDANVKSPTSIKSPISATSHRRHGSTGSAHSFVPEKTEPEPREHRGSEISAASEEEIKRIESECAIPEEDEEEEMDEATEDAILFGDGEDGDKEEVKDQAADKNKVEDTDMKSSTAESEPSLESGKGTTEAAGKGQSDTMQKPLNIKGGPNKIKAIMKSAGVEPSRTEAETSKANNEDDN